MKNSEDSTAKTDRSSDLAYYYGRRDRELADAWRRNEHVVLMRALELQRLLPGFVIWANGGQYKVSFNGRYESAVGLPLPHLRTLIEREFDYVEAVQAALSRKKSCSSPISIG